MNAKQRRSRKRFARNSRQPPEPLVFYLDRNLGKYIIADRLREANIAVEVHDDHLPVRDGTTQVAFEPVDFVARYTLGKNQDNGIMVGYRYKSAEFDNSGLEKDYEYQGPAIGFNFSI